MLLNNFSVPSSSCTPGANLTGDISVTRTLSPTRNFGLAISRTVTYLSDLQRQSGPFRSASLSAPFTLRSRFHATDTSSQIWARQSSPPPHRRVVALRQASRRWCQVPLILEMNPVARCHNFVEGQPRLRAIPANEVIDGTSIAALRFR